MSRPGLVAASTAYPAGQIGNAHFTWFGTTNSKNRANFLELLRAGHGDYVINAEALAYMCQRKLATHYYLRKSLEYYIDSKKRFFGQRVPKRPDFTKTARALLDALLADT